MPYFDLYKIMHIKYIFIALTIFLISKSGLAVTLQQSILAASLYNSEIKAAHNAFEADNQKKYQGFSGLLPSITFDTTWAKTDQPDATYAAGVTKHNYSFNLKQPVFDVARYATWRKSIAISNLAEVNYLKAQQKLIYDVISAYYLVNYQRSVLEANIKNRNAFNIQLRQARKALTVGEGTKIDVIEAQANYDKANADELASQNALHDASIAFRQLSGIDALEIPSLGMTCVPDTENLNEAQLIKIGQKSNLDIQAALHSLKGSEADLIATNSQHLPVITFQASYGKNWSRAENGNIYDEIFGTTSKTDNSVIALNVSIPIFSGGGQISQSLEAAHRREQSKNLLADAQRKMEQDVMQFFSGVANGLSQIRAYQQSVHSSKARLSSTSYGRQMGQRTLIDEFSAEKEYYQAIQSLAQAKYNYIISLAKLKSATGELDYSLVKIFSCGAA